MGGKRGGWETALRSWFIGAGVKRVPRIITLSRGGGRNVTSKNNRIAAAIPYWVDGHVKLVQGAPGVEKLIHQMTRLGIATHDDWADASADVFHPDVYTPLVMGKLGEEIGEVPVQPGDDLLKGLRRPR